MYIIFYLNLYPICPVFDIIVWPFCFVKIYNIDKRLKEMIIYINYYLVNWMKIIRRERNELLQKTLQKVKESSGSELLWWNKQRYFSLMLYAHCKHIWINMWGFIFLLCGVSFIQCSHVLNFVLILLNIFSILVPVYMIKWEGDWLFE